MHTVTTLSPEETAGIGCRLAAELAPGDFIVLSGDLGAGKTQFAKGVAAGLHLDPHICVTSPTYTIMNVYSGRIPLYHFDLYRLASEEEVIELGFEDYFYGNGVCLVEWGERLAEEMPRETLTVRFSHLTEKARSLTFIPSGDRPLQIVRKLFPE